MFSNRWEQQSRRRWKRGWFLWSIRRRLQRRIGPWIAIPAYPPRAQLAAQVFCAAVTIQRLHTHAIMSSDVSNKQSVCHRFVSRSRWRRSSFSAAYTDSSCDAIFQMNCLYAIDFRLFCAKHDLLWFDFMSRGEVYLKKCKGTEFKKSLTLKCIMAVVFVERMYFYGFTFGLRITDYEGKRTIVFGL